LNRLEHLAEDLVSRHRNRLRETLGSLPLPLGLVCSDGAPKELAKRVAAHNVKVGELAAVEKQTEAIVEAVGKVLIDGAGVLDVLTATEDASRMRFEAARLRLGILSSLKALLVDLLADANLRRDLAEGLREEAAAEVAKALQDAGQGPERDPVIAEAWDESSRRANLAVARERFRERVNADPSVQKIQSTLSGLRVELDRLTARGARLDGEVDLAQAELIAAWRAMGGQGL
jgi:hypothetical protein